MKIQKSFQNNSETGALYVVPTPIGNLDDITIRGLNTLQEVDLIAAEDTRHTRKLLNHFDIKTPLTSYHEHSEKSKLDQIVNELTLGKQIALVSDAGMPGISDPGEQLIKESIKKDIRVIVLPGANAAISALVGSGLSTDSFYFYGFLPRKNKDRNQAWKLLQSQQATIILYESPYRVKQTLQDVKKQLGNRNVVLARELTKKFEEYIRGTADEVLTWLDEGIVKGEFCIIIEGNQNLATAQASWWKDLTVIEHVNHYIEADEFTSKQAVKKVADERGLRKRDVYQQYHID